MKKLFIKYLLLSVILLSGYSQLYTYLSGANTVVNNDNLVQIENVSSVVHSNNDTYVAKSSLLHFEKLNYEIEISDGEDDETSSSRKNLKTSSYFSKNTTSFQDDFLLNSIQQASFYKKLSHLVSCKKFILLRVIRI